MVFESLMKTFIDNKNFFNMDSDNMVKTTYLRSAE